MAVQTTLVNKPLNPRGNDQSPLAYNRAKLFSGKALDFDGVNDKVDLPTLSFDLYAFSFYYEGAINSGTGQFIFHTGDGTNDGVSIGSVTSLLTGETLTIGDNGNYTAITESFDDAIHFIVCTWNATENKYNFYLNAQKLSTINSGTDAPLISLSTAPAIGYRKAIGDMYLNGNISNVRAFNTALTAAQVADLYNNPEKVVPTGVDNTALKLWLPMQEGAGTTAYDGSGNGNHGTISGATYVNGVGAPVSQTAVIDWNKGTNLTLYSEDGSVWGTGGNAPTITQDQPDPFEGTRAQRIQMDKASNYAQIVKQHTQISASVQYTAKMWLKAVSGTPTIGINYNGSGGSWQNVTLTNEWAEYEVTRTMNADYEYSHNILIGNPAPGTSSTADFYIYGLQIQLGDTAGPYVPTFGTAQTSEVLLPQGLTTGRDITGVNLFENVRKQGALNLDGNSWAEVHDNASLDVTTAVTLEAWVQNSDEDGKGLLGRWFSGTACYMLYKTADNNNFNFYINSSFITSGTVTACDWHHIVGVYDGTTKKIYVNGVEEGANAETATINTSSDPIEIGRFYSGPGYRTLANQIAQPRIYNRALTAEEVLKNYNATSSLYI